MTGLAKGLEGREKGKSEVRHRELSRKPLIFLFVQLNAWGPICGDREHSEKKKERKKKPKFGDVWSEIC